MTKEEFREKWDNYWYHYKARTWICIFAIFLIVYTIFDFSTRQVSDFDITYIGDYMDYEGLATEITENYAELIGDINGDGKFKAEVNAVYTTEGLEPEKDMNFWQRIDVDLLNGESYIYLVDEDIFPKLQERGAVGVIKTKDGYTTHIDISENEKLKKFLPKDKKVFLCVREKLQGNTDEKIKATEEKSLLLIEKILEN